MHVLELTEGFVVVFAPRLRLQEGFHIACNNAGILTMAKEVTMKVRLILLISVSFSWHLPRHAVVSQIAEEIALVTLSTCLQLQTQKKKTMQKKKNLQKELSSLSQLGAS